ncbi:hypothetical protein FIBSPDRAFT_935897 [Athelia psychrophila]|uniref:Uncharacterized protein n=1 Tax=Athelia psychrophila TaxID=1759441 RepID=A0A166CZF5_9AGAM|nr:hypothetical protein FIBSPDRAFT_935897 [Fibularhizoctonia sp. CBS 109695]
MHEVGATPNNDIPFQQAPTACAKPPAGKLLGQYPASASLIGIGSLSMPGTSDRPSVLLTLSVLTGLPILLWAYKSAMVYLFQRLGKIIYMGYVPPGARTEELGRDFPARLLRSTNTIKDGATVDIGIVYFQGNAGNPLHRIPLFQTLLRPSPFPFHLNPLASQSSPPKLAILAVAPRSYWKLSASKPTQRGLTNDYAHVLSYAVHRWPTDPLYANIQGLILENPFSSIPAMIRALYPEKWTPYHHHHHHHHHMGLGPLVWDAWDAVGAITAILPPPSSHTLSVQKDEPGAQNPIQRGTRDNMVPRKMGEELWTAASASATHSNFVIVNIFGAITSFHEFLFVFGAVSSKKSNDMRSADGGMAMARRVIIADGLHKNPRQRRQWLREMTRYIGRHMLVAARMDIDGGGRVGSRLMKGITGT